jgi:hypothetical protein
MPNESAVLQQIRQSAAELEGWSSLCRPLTSSSAGVHLAVLIEPYLGYILQHKKTVESRFSKNCIAPFQRINAGDLVLLKATAGPVVGCFTAAWVNCMELDAERLAEVRTTYAEAICADAAFWHTRAGKRYVTLVGVDQPCRLPPVRVAKSDRRGWIVLRASTQAEAQLSLL